MSSSAFSFNFRSIPVIPSSEELKDTCLSKTQRRTPTEVHHQYGIARIRHFYIRKVKFLQQSYHDKIDEIVFNFPHVDKVHPFHADIINILYDKDHYKIALGQLNLCKKLVDKVASDYFKLLKYGDSLYRCKMLKIAAFGRMSKLVEKQKETLEYLESVRQHMTRLPVINPNERTLLLAGFPNVGKSSFLNSVSNAHVDVQPYPFTTRSIFVGMTSAYNIQWQVLDTPGVLDKPLMERNSIEMLSITALAHLKASVIYFMDLSESCGYSFEEQLSLFESIKPLFTDKPLLLALNKCDELKFEDMSPEKQQQIKDLCKNAENPIPCFEISTKTNYNIHELKLEACKLLLKKRVETKLKSYNKADAAAKRIKVFYPDNWSKEEIESREKVIDENEMPVEVDEEKLFEDAEKLHSNPRLAADLRKPDEINDKIPEFYKGYNVADFMNPNVNEKISELKLEEIQRDENGFYDLPILPDDEETREQRKLARMIREKKIIARRRSQIKSTPAPGMSRVNKKSTLLTQALQKKKYAPSRYFDYNKQIKEVKNDRSNDANPSASNIVKYQNKSSDIVLSKDEVKFGKNVSDSNRKINLRVYKAKQMHFEKNPKHLFVGKVNVKGKRDYR